MFGGDCGVWRGFVMSGDFCGVCCVLRGLRVFGGVLWGLWCLGVFVGFRAYDGVSVV